MKYWSTGCYPLSDNCLITTLHGGRRDAGAQAFNLKA